LLLLYFENHIEANALLIGCVVGSSLIKTVLYFWVCTIDFNFNSQLQKGADGKKKYFLFNLNLTLKTFGCDNFFSRTK
jgi:hypothetical protein